MGAPLPRAETRIELWIGAYALLAIAVIVLPALVLVEQHLEASLVANEIDMVSREERLVVTTLAHRVAASERSVTRLARRVSETAAPITPSEVQGFEQLVARDADGAHRSRPASFDAVTQAGIWVPRHAPMDDDSRGFYVRVKHLIEDTMRGGDDTLSENAWLLVDGGGEVILWPAAPLFIYEAAANHDYSDTEWVNLARPANNPDGRPRWTRVEFDPVPSVWMVSVVAPYTRNGRFAGSVGHDVPLDRLIAGGAALSERAGATYMVIDREGRLLASARYAAEIQAGRGDYSVDDVADAPLRSAVQRLMRATQDSTEVQRIETRALIVLGTRLEATGWTTISAIPRETITERVAEPVRTMRNATLAALLLVFAASLVTIIQDRRRRQRALLQLRESDEKLARAQKLDVLGRFAGGIAHDFNNILTVINGFAQIAMARSREDETQRDHLRQITRACMRAAELTRQLLAFARTQPIAPQVMDVNDLVRDTHKLLRRVIGEDVEVISLPSPTPACVLMDAGQLEQVLTNLAVNARDAMPDGGALTVRVEVGDHRVVLKVSDTGVGMPEHVRKNATEPFFTTKEAGRGTGLGLSTCLAIVEQAGGTLEIQSQVGQGTTFTLSFPQADSTQLVPPMRSEPPPAPRGEGQLILLVEDDAQVRNATSELLRALGFDVVEADNGASGLGVVRERHKDLACVLTDVVMPILGGGPFLALLRAEHPSLPVVVTSGYVDDPRLRDDLRDLTLEFLPKPFTADQLSRALARAMSATSA